MQAVVLEMSRVVGRLIGVALIWCAFATHALATLATEGEGQYSNHEELAADGVSVLAWVEPSLPVKITQQLELNIEVAVASWFTGGTKISHFEVDDMIVLRREKFAVNSTRDIGGKEWTVQLWTISLYPQRAGEYRIPPINLEIQMADANGAPSTKSVSTKAILISAQPPELLREGEANSNLLVTSKLSLSDQFNGRLENLEVGDAIERIIEVQAEDLAAMMLPQFEMPTIDGLAIYRKPATLTDKSNRGVYQALRSETFSLIVEKPGNYRLPEIQVQWWDVVAGSLRTEIIEAKFISTKGLASAASSVSDTEDGLQKLGVPKYSLKYFLLALVGVILAVCIGLLIRRASISWSSAARREQQIQKRNYRRYCNQGDYHLADLALSKWMHLRAKSHELFSVREMLEDANISDDLIAQYELLTSMAYGKGIVDEKGQNTVAKLGGLLSGIESELGSEKRKQSSSNKNKARENLSYERLRSQLASQKSN